MKKTAISLILAMILTLTIGGPTLADQPPGVPPGHGPLGIDHNASEPPQVYILAPAANTHARDGFECPGRNANPNNNAAGFTRAQ